MKRGPKPTHPTIRKAAVEMALRSTFAAAAEHFGVSIGTVARWRDQEAI